jgi:S1-C subfamily serine protease
MYFRTVSLALSILFCLAHAAVGQQRICINGRCFRTQVVPTAPPVWRQDSRGVSGITLDPLREELWLGGSDLEADEEAQVGDRFDQVIEATVRVTTNGSCGSGTIVGRDKDGNAIVLTNAHVAGTTRGRAVNLERWNTDGASERGNGTIIASGYGRGTNVDFALLKCNAEFAQDVAPIPLADRYPSAVSVKCGELSVPE